jgi:hypothetical protein
VFPIQVHGTEVTETIRNGNIEEQDAQRLPLMLCVNSWGLRFAVPFLEEIVLEFPFDAAQKWSIQRNDVCEITIVNPLSKKTLKTLMLSFSCERSEGVYAALEACSKGASPSDVIMSPRNRGK